MPEIIYTPSMLYAFATLFCIVAFVNTLAWCAEQPGRVGGAARFISLVFPVMTTVLLIDVFMSGNQAYFLRGLIWLFNEGEQ